MNIFFYMYPEVFLPNDSRNFLFNSKKLQQDYITFLMERRFQYNNVNQYISLKDVILSYKNLNITSALHNGLIANFFFLRYFTGKMPFFLPVKVISTFKTKTYNFQCNVRLTRKDAFNLILTQISFASKNVSSSDFGIVPNTNLDREIIFFIKNFPYLRIVETHPVFFK